MVWGGTEGRVLLAGGRRPTDKTQKADFVSFLPPFLEREKRFELSTSTLARASDASPAVPRRAKYAEIV
jgi:hypothetical protein